MTRQQQQALHAASQRGFRPDPQLVRLLSEAVEALGFATTAAESMSNRRTLIADDRRAITFALDRLNAMCAQLESASNA